MNDQVLLKLADSFDDMKERLIRIEENVKRISDIQADVDTLKLSVAEVTSSTKSAHRRLDDLLHKEHAKEKDIKWLKNTVITGFIGFFFTLLSTIIIGIFKGWI